MDIPRFITASPYLPPVGLNAIRPRSAPGKYHDDDWAGVEGKGFWRWCYYSCAIPDKAFQEFHAPATKRASSREFFHQVSGYRDKVQLHEFEFKLILLLPISACIWYWTLPIETSVGYTGEMREEDGRSEGSNRVSPTGDSPTTLEMKLRLNRGYPARPEVSMNKA
ncbi:hypothetical protein CC2G_000027 [Coprinopsis cinerea AmutBmut pab1-1]|nr:hypothetical protein CC2G_000027 [Coprinopsis cinerea AmutBmut pab1-1]